MGYTYQTGYVRTYTFLYVEWHLWNHWAIKEVRLYRQKHWTAAHAGTPLSKWSHIDLVRFESRAEWEWFHGHRNIQQFWHHQVVH